jgi:hypothetical protein
VQEDWKRARAYPIRRSIVEAKEDYFFMSIELIPLLLWHFFPFSRRTIGNQESYRLEGEITTSTNLKSCLPKCVGGDSLSTSSTKITSTKKFTIEEACEVLLLFFFFFSYWIDLRFWSLFFCEKRQALCLR